MRVLRFISNILRDAGDSPGMQRFMRFLSVLGTVCLLYACSIKRTETQSDQVRGYLRLAVALGERDPDSLDYYYGPSDWVSDVRTNPLSLREIKQSALGLVDRLKLRPREPRADFLVMQLKALASRADLLLGVRHSFDDEAEELFGVRPQLSAATEHSAEVREQLATLLPGGGTLAERFAAFDARFTVPSEKVPNVLERALSACRARTIAHVALTPGEQVTVEYVNNKPWNAFSRYLGNYHSRVEINADYPMTVDRILDLACHEGYPGHHAFNSLQDQVRVQREGRLELMVQPTFSPQSFASESIATVAGDVAFPQADRLAFERDELFPMADLDPKLVERYLLVERLVSELADEQVAIARDYLDGKLEFVRAGSALESKALMAHSEATLKYINEYRTYMLTYTVGRRLALACLAAAGSGTMDSWSRYRQLMLSQVSVTECKNAPIDIARPRP